MPGLRRFRDRTACDVLARDHGTYRQPLGHPFTVSDDRQARQDRAWLAASLARSEPAARVAYLAHAAWAGSPARQPSTDGELPLQLCGRE